MPTPTPARPLAEWAPHLREARLRVDGIEAQFGHGAYETSPAEDIELCLTTRATLLTVAEERAAGLAREGYAA
jgi:hypothetical protein